MKPKPASSFDYEKEPPRFRERRDAMVRHDLNRRGISDPRVLAAMGQVPRQEYVPESLREYAYDDRALPIPHGQTISQPFTVAYMAQALHLSGQEQVLEIGTGSGYGAAVLSRLAKQVHTVERIPQLAEEASQRLGRCGYKNVTVHTSDGTLGLPENSPYDAIIVTAGAESVPEALLDELAEGGRLVIPVGGLHHQILHRYTRRGDQFLIDDLGYFAFVPLISDPL